LFLMFLQFVQVYQLQVYRLQIYQKVKAKK